MKRPKYRVYTNSLFRKIISAYIAFLLIMGSLACYFAYSNAYNKTMYRLGNVMQDMQYNYTSYTEDFWKIYMPIFENRNSMYTVLESYFAGSEQELNPLEKQKLADVLQGIMQYDRRIAWIGIYADNRTVNYMLMGGSTTIVKIDESFPFAQELQNKGSTMEVYSSKLIPIGDSELRCFAVCGNAPGGMGSGKLIVGYATKELEPSYYAGDDLENVRFWLTSEHGIVFDTNNTYDAPAYTGNGVSWQNGTLVQTGRLQGSNSYGVFYTMPWVDLLLGSHHYAISIAVLCLLFLAGSLVVYFLMGRIIIKKVDGIHYGLSKIAENNLDYRIPVQQTPADEFENISSAINQMSQQLQDNVEKANRANMRQREAELSELQTKFDPHFLYNTLEVIRGRACEDGDDEIAGVMVKLAQIFRSFLSGEHFVSIQEELDFCNRYLAILKYRYEDQAQIIYDVDSNVLSCGIIRNLIQPILENYFIHGFDAERQDNYLRIRIKLEGKYVKFYFRDNGLGITPERLKELKENLQTVEPRNSYGLKNVKRRIQLFYGQDCGLEVDCNEENGATIRMKILNLSCQEHKKRLSYSE